MCVQLLMWNNCLTMSPNHYISVCMILAVSNFWSRSWNLFTLNWSWILQSISRFSTLCISCPVFTTKLWQQLANWMRSQRNNYMLGVVAVLFVDDIYLNASSMNVVIEDNYCQEILKSGFDIVFGDNNYSWKASRCWKMEFGLDWLPIPPVFVLIWGWCSSSWSTCIR